MSARRPLNLFKKLLGFLLIFSLILIFSKCKKESPLNQDDYTKLLKLKESKFIESLNPTLNTILIGYKTVNIDAESIASFNKFYFENKDEIDNLHGRFYDPLAGNYIVYFPLKGAIINVENTILNATEKGEVHINKNINLSNIQVIGRNKTEFITGVLTNTVKEDTIFLESPVRANHIVKNNVLVFDFGERIPMNHNHHSEPESEESIMAAVSCMANHLHPITGAARNCTTTFPAIAQGRCPFNAAVCMDYNGAFTDCINHGGGWGKYRNFIFSDCDYALGSGNCWNEIM